MKRIITALSIGLAAMALSACDVSNAELMDPVVRAMASDEQIARFEAVLLTLREDDVEGLEAMLAEGFPENFAQEAVDYFPNDVPSAVLFTAFNTRTNFTSAGRTRSQTFAATVEFEFGSYMVQTVYAAQGGDELRLSQLRLIPLFEDAAERDPAAEPSADAPNP